VFRAFHHIIYHSGFAVRHGPALLLLVYSRAAPVLWAFGTEAAGLRRTTTAATVETWTKSNALLAGLHESSSGIKSNALLAWLHESSSGMTRINYISCLQSSVILSFPVERSPIWNL